MHKLLLPIAALLISDALLLTGHGLQLTLLPLRAALEGFSDAQIGLTGSAYFIGFVAGCLLSPLVVRRVGHIRSFAVLTSAFSALILVFDLIPHFWTWLLLRFMTGACISGLYMIIESWLNERSTSETRGTVLSIYTIINLSMIVLGQQLINLAEPETTTLFAIAAILLSLAIIPVSMTSALAPAPLHRVRIDARKVWNLSRVGVGGAVAAGLATGAFWSLGPVYAREAGLSTRDLTWFMSLAVLGGAVLQFPLGRLSDHFDRRIIVAATAATGTLVSAALGLLTAAPFTVLLALAFFWGATSMTLYAICLAHANDRAEPEDFVMVGTSILLMFGAASALGAPLAALLMWLAGPGGLFLFSALVMALLTIGTIRRRRTHYLPVVDETVPFRQVAAVGTPAALEMDPRTEIAAVPMPEPPPDHPEAAEYAASHKQAPPAAADEAAPESRS